MRTYFHPFLPNGLTGDPVLRVDRLDAGSSLLLDLGDLHAISNRNLLRVDRVVVTHTHLDHFIGFDHLLRLTLGRERELVLAGPAGFLDNVEGRLAGYCWNLIESYPLRLRVEEVDGTTVRSASFTGAGGLRRQSRGERAFNGRLHDEDEFEIRVEVLDHGTPVLGVALCEKERLAVNKDRLEKMGLEPGPWLGELKRSMQHGPPPPGTVRVLMRGGTEREFSGSELAAELLSREPGQKIAYICDLRHSRDNVDRVVALADGASLMVCEAVFLHEDEALARERNHLTARQAGELARRAGAARLAPFHLSSRYEDRQEELLEEAERAFGGPVVRLPAGPTIE